MNGKKAKALRKAEGVNHGLVKAEKKMAQLAEQRANRKVLMKEYFEDKLGFSANDAATIVDSVAGEK